MKVSETLTYRVKLIILAGVLSCIFNTCGLSAEAVCRSGCRQADSGLFRYIAGNVYEYSLDSTMTVGLGQRGPNVDETSLKLIGVAKLYAEGNCGYTLQLSGIRVTAIKESLEKKIMQSIQKPVQFTMTGGNIDPELCVDPNDSIYALNIKRAVISLLQSSNSKSATEVDVFGQCSTHTTVATHGDNEIITKMRNLNDCGYREQIQNGIITSVVNEKSEVKSSSLLLANYVKESIIGRGIINKVHLVEEYKFAGSSRDGTMAHAKVSTTLKIKNSSGTVAAAPSVNAVKRTILFEKPESYAIKNMAALKTALGELVELVSDYVKRDTAQHFVELIRLMRQADADTLLELSTVQYPNKVMARKVYLDALFRTSTVESAKVIFKQFQKFNDKEKIIALLSLNMIQTVDREVLTQVTTLLAPNTPKEAFLAVGNIVQKYCYRNGCEQGDIDTVSRKLTDNLKHCRVNTKREEERIVYVLKGIRNMQPFGRGVTAAIIECAATGRSNRIRIAAVQAFVSHSCDETLQKKALELLRDHNEDSELRIEAYLSLIECPSAQISNDIAEIVNNEPVHQVGGFIASNLKAIRDSTDATRENQRYFLGNIRITKSFEKDFRRYSFNNEVSYKFTPLGVSASVDYKLIYSQNGFLPRSARLNVTTELMGHNFNIFEASIRQENLEDVLEYYVGPKGLLNKDFNEIVKVIENGGVPENDSGRKKRSIADESEKFSRKYKTYGKKPDRDLNLDIAMKLFGSEIMFLSLGDNIPSSLDEIIAYVSKTFEEVKNELSSFNKEFTMHSLFVDTDFMYPTGVGIPFEFSVQGFSSNKIDFGVNVDIDAILEQNWQRAKYRLKIVPSISVSLNAKLAFNAYVVTTGLRFSSSMYSATGSDLHMSFSNDGNGFDLDINLPRGKIEFIDLNILTDFFVAEQDKPIKSVPLKSVNKKKTAPNNEMCFNQGESMGLTFCLNTNIALGGQEKSFKTGRPQSFFEDLANPISLNIYVITELKHNLRGSHTPATATGGEVWRVEYSTPGSKVSHDTSLTFELGNKPKMYARASFDCPQYHLGLEAGLTNDNKELMLYAQLENNDDVRRNKIGFIKNGNEYRPIIEIRDKSGAVINHINGYRADGKLIVQKSGDKLSKYIFENVEITNGENKRLVINGWADVGPASLKSELHIGPGEESYLVKSHLQIDNGEYSMGLFVNDEKISDNIFGGSVKLKVEKQEINLHLVGKAGTWEVNSGSELQYTQSDGSTSIASTKFSNTLAIKNKNIIVYSLKLNGLTEQETRFELDVELGRENKVGALTIKLKRNQKAQNDYLLELNGKLNKHFVNVFAKCDVNGNRFLVENVLTTSWGTSLTAKGEVGQRYTVQDIYINLQGTAQFSTKEKATQWLIKVFGTPEKTTTELRLTRDNVDLFKCIGDLQHPQDKINSGKVNLIIKNVISGKADFKVARNGKGEIVLIAENLKADSKQKVEVTTKFHVQAPKYDIETIASLNDAHKFYFKTENTLDKSKFTTKNIGRILENAILFDANGSVKGDWQINGEIQGNFKFTCPMGRIIDGSAKRRIVTNTKTGISQGHMEVQLNDQLPNGGKRRTVELTGKVEKLNIKTKEISTNVHILYTDFEGKKIDFTNHVKHLKKDENKMIDIAAHIEGDLLNLPVDIMFLIEEYSRTHAVFSVSTKIGEHIMAKANGNYKFGEQNFPTTFEIQSNLISPHSSWKSMDVTASGNLVRPATAEGNYILKLHVDEKTGNGEFFKLNTMLKASKQQCAYSIDLDTNKMNGPLKIDGFYQNDKSDSGSDVTQSQKFNFGFNYDDKYIKSTGEISLNPVASFNMQYTLDTSSERAKDIVVNVDVQKLPTGSFTLQLQANQASNVYKMDSTIYQSAHKKGVELHLTVPKSQPIVVFGVFELLGERKAKCKFQIENILDLDLIANAEASYKTVDNFYLTAQWNSIKLNFDNFDLSIRSENKVITLNLKHKEGLILSGSANYALKNEKNKAIIEGHGQIQWKAQTQNLNFKLIRQLYDVENDKEMGFSYTFNGNFGSKNSVSTLKITNKDFNVKFSICEEKKQCSNLQIQSLFAISDTDIGAIQHSLLVLIDLRELGYPYELDIQSKTIRNGLKYQYSLDSTIISSNNNKYQLVINILPTNKKLQLLLPTREILFETQQTFPQTGKIFGHYENTFAFYFDKLNKPNDITRLSISADITGTDRISINSRGEIRFEHPSIRPLSISGKLEANRAQQVVDTTIVFDIFLTEEQKIVLTSLIENTENRQGFNIRTANALTSVGLGIKNELNAHTSLKLEEQELSAGAEWNSGIDGHIASGSLLVKRDHIEVLIKALDEEILQFKGDFNRQKYLAKFETKLQIFGQKTLEQKTELQPTMARFSIKRSGLVSASCDIKIGKDVKFNLEGAGKALITGRVALDAANFLQTTYNSNEEDIKTFLDIVETEAEKESKMAREQINAKYQKLRTVIGDQLKASKERMPDFSKLQDNYGSHAKQIIDELEKDPSMKKIAEQYRTLYVKLSKIVKDIVNTCSELYGKLYASLKDTYNKFEVILNETIIPAWEELLISIHKIVSELRVEAIHLYTKSLETIIGSLEKYGPVLRNYGKIVNDSLKPLYEAVQEVFKVASQALEEVINEFKENISKLPSFDTISNELKKILEKLKLTENTLKIIDHIFDQLHILPTTPETSEFLEKAHNYLISKIKQQPIDDDQITQELIQLFVKAVRSIWATLDLGTSAGSFNYTSNGLTNLLSTLPLSVDIFQKFPALLSFRFSAINFLLNENWENIFSKDHFRSWILFNDFQLHGHIADGHHIFTFDGKYYAFPGTCKYILSQDSVDNNFTVIGQLNNGKLKSVVLIDRDDNYLELNDSGALKFNGNPVELPLHERGMHSWRLFYTVYLRSEYGVEVVCTNDLKICHIVLNGFYTSKTRGLLGNGNAEPNDDFLQPDSTIAKDFATFGNGYGLSKCSPVQSDQNSVVRSDICSDIFSLESPLAIGYLFQSVKPYRTACDEAVGAVPEKEKESAACTIATAYGSALKIAKKPVLLPFRCLKCSGAQGQRDIGQEFTVKTPGTKADIVFVVDLGVSQMVLRNLVAPAITEVRETMKSRGFTDIQIGVIAYNESQRYPALLTSNGGQLNYQGNLAELQLNGPSTFCDSSVLQIINDKRILDVYDLIDRVMKAVVPQSDEMAYRLALNYPFRVGAAKSIIGVRSNRLNYDSLFKFVRAHLEEVTHNFDSAILHLIEPVEGMSLEGVQTEKLVGFNSRLVATIDGKDAKKRQKLQFRNDMGIDLVLENGGWVFTTQNFDGLKPLDQKKALTQVTNSIADTMFKTDMVSDCRCMPVHGLHAQHKCFIKSSTFVPNKRVKTKK